MYLKKFSLFNICTTWRRFTIPVDEIDLAVGSAEEETRDQKRCEESHCENCELCIVQHAGLKGGRLNTILCSSEDNPVMIETEGDTADLASKQRDKKQIFPPCFSRNACVS